MIVACVRTGNKYPSEYVHRLRLMVEKYLTNDYEFICLTDHPREVNCNTLDISEFYLNGWWGKMALFEPTWRKGERVIYFDLDTVICGDLSPLFNLFVDFGLCANFTRASGNKSWPCHYGSCVMTIGPNRCEDVWHNFNANDVRLMRSAGNYGDQKVIEELSPGATLLQDVLPKGFFLGYRDLTNYKPKGCSVVVFAGSSKPHNCEKEWIREAWELS